MPDEEVRKITFENAARVFQFDPFTRRTPEQCTVRSLRAEVSDWDISPEARFKHRTSNARGSPAKRCGPVGAGLRTAVTASGTTGSTRGQCTEAPVSSGIGGVATTRAASPPSEGDGHPAQEGSRTAQWCVTSVPLLAEH